MKTSTKVIVATAAGILSAGLATAGAFAATGSLSVSDAPGQVLKLGGVGPAAGHANKQALSHADENAKGLFGGTPTPTPTPTPTAIPIPTSSPVSGDASTDTSDEPDADDPTTGTTPTADEKDSSTAKGDAKGDANGDAVSAWAKAHGGAQVVTPPAAVDVQVDGSAKADH